MLIKTKVIPFANSYERQGIVIPLEYNNTA